MSVQAAPAVVIRESKSSGLRVITDFSPSDSSDSIAVQQGNLVEQGTDEALMAPHRRSTGIMSTGRPSAERWRQEAARHQQAAGLR